jgi:UDP-glucose 4-epimerase
MKVLVTGGSGFIGSHASVELIQKSHDVCIIDNFINRSKSTIDNIIQLTGKQFCFLEGDLRDKSFLDLVFKTYSPDAVMHFAGLKSVSESIDEPIKYYDFNVNGSIQLLKTMDKYNCKNIIFSSSATVYKESSQELFEETSQVSPINPYGKTKLFIEEVISDWVKIDKDKKGVCLRYFNPAGAHNSGLIGENPNGIPNNLIPMILKVALGEIDYLPIFGSDYPTRDGTGIRDYIHISDIANSHVKVLESLDKIDKYEIFNLGTGYGVTVLEIVKEFEKIIGKSINTKLLNRRLGDVAVTVANSKKIEKQLGIISKKSIKEICKDVWNWKFKSKKLYP